MDIGNFIRDFEVRNGKHFFLNGGCYIFARILQVNYGGVIYSNIDHCMLRKNNIFYDIGGARSHMEAIEDGYIPIDEMCEARYKKYENFT